MTHYEQGWPVLPGIFTTDNLANEKVFNASLAEYIANRTGPLAEVALGGGFLSAQYVCPAVVHVFGIKDQRRSSDKLDSSRICADYLTHL